MPLDQFSIIESTLREGEQFVNAFFTTEQKIELARMLDDFGVSTSNSPRPWPRRAAATIAPPSPPWD